MITVPSFTSVNSIVDEGKLVGIVSRANVIQALIARPSIQPVAASKSDKDIRSALLTEFVNYPRSNSSTFNVAVDEGVVRYWGFIESNGAKEAMRLAAENMADVKSGESNLGVASCSPDYF